ncbi:MAG: TIGR04283 family arsenosugar biosynthesis glycosyltransferase [Rubricoccaceae bacterium]
MLVSIIIPALDEAARIAETVAAAHAQDGPLEVIVADGASGDGTAAVAQAAGARVVAAPRGRAAQMNAGAAAASGAAFVFLHADTRLPPDGLARVRAALARPGVAGGCFRTTFDERRSAWLRLFEARLWMRWHRLAFGDRALFARREAFAAVGGFPAQPIFEDLDFVRALRRQGRFVFLNAPVVTSARRFVRHGALRQQARNLALWLAWNAGADPARLKRYYPDAPGARGD